LLHQLPLTSDISRIFLDLMEEYSLSHKLSLPDALIAATVLEHDLELYTLNVRDFGFISGLALFAPD
jgi:tRNA(fMet)-specific endonuclease VapC